MKPKPKLSIPTLEVLHKNGLEANIKAYSYFLLLELNQLVQPAKSRINLNRNIGALNFVGVRFSTTCLYKSTVHQYKLIYECFLFVN